MMLNIASKKIPNCNLRVLTDFELLAVCGGRGMGRGSNRIGSQSGNGGLPGSCPVGTSMQLQGMTVSTTSVTGSVSATVGVLSGGTLSANTPSTTIVKSYECTPPTTSIPKIPLPKTSDKEQEGDG